MLLGSIRRLKRIYFSNPALAAQRALHHLCQLPHRLQEWKATSEHQQQGAVKLPANQVHPSAEVWQKSGRTVARLAFDIRLDSSSATARSEQDALAPGMRTPAYRRSATKSPSGMS